MKIFLSGIISGIRNIVIMIVACEFIKAFMIDDNFKKYITVCINIIVIGFIIGEIKNVPFDPDINFEMRAYQSDYSANAIKEEYESRVCESLKTMLYNKKILVYDIEVLANEDYSIKNIVVTINENREEAEKILKEMKAENYEIYVSDN